MANINDMMEDDGYAGYEADPLDDNYQVKCGQILVSATQKFSLRCAGCDLEYDNLREFINHCIEMHSFTDFEIDSKTNVPGRKSVFDPNDDSNTSNLITMAPPAYGSLDESNNSFNSLSTKKNNNYDDKDDESEEDEEEEEEEEPEIEIKKSKVVAKHSKEYKPLITLKPLEVLQKRKPEYIEDDFRPPRKRVYDQSECRFHCKYCDKSYPYSSSLSKHRKTFHNDIKKYKCTFCDSRFTDEIYLIRHQRARHKNELQPYLEDPVIILDNVDDENKRNSDYNNSSIKSEPIDDYETSTNTNDDFVVENRRRNESFMKEKSNSSTNESGSQQTLVDKKLPITRAPKVIYKCTMCPEEDNVTFRSKKEWQAHENHAHLQPDKFRCQTCNIAYPSKKLFQDHEQEKHQDQRPYKCPICFFAFKERKHLMRHERVHTGEKPFKCPLCNEQFTRKDALKTHHMKEHPEINFD